MMLPRLSDDGMIRQLSSFRSLRKTLIAGGVLSAVLFGAVGVLAAGFTLSGAIIAPGTLVVESSVKQVQHLEGGIVGEILVKDGDRVSVGTELVRLDATVTKANLAVVVKSMDQYDARLARLQAERDGKDSISFPQSLLDRQSEDEIAESINGERVVFDTRRTVRDSKISQLRERINQLHEEIGGIEAQIDAKAREVEFVQKELTGVRELWKKNLIPIQRVSQLERDATRIGGERGALIASAASAKGKVTETELQILQIDQDLKSEVARDIREAQSKLGELAERRIAAEESLKRIAIRAPRDGIVHQLAVHTVGGVIAAGEVLMQIVPDLDALTVEARVSPTDIDRMYVGQAATLHFSAFDRGTTPEINGRVSRISADLEHDQRTQVSYYLVRLAFSSDDLSKNGLKAVPGMPVEAFISTGNRTMLSYVLKPLTDQLARSFRES
ncbi:HlyD family type I secretion periplasmic adaptor subunit [Flaviflagellibacter deserti]|uniref:Membrane fusion protein (MFP) family protein n=1 Tax=Flaviflagellibacter deserti TaxID=2267266 RepID=A0ABV9Z0P9_9HYPH